jgi:hypothetical protein
MAIFMVSGRSYSTAAMHRNKVVFGTPEARAWFLSKLRPPNASHDDKLALRMIFGDFYTSIAQYRKDATSANAANALTQIELREASLKTRDSARSALADEFRRLLSWVLYVYF